MDKKEIEASLVKLDRIRAEIAKIEKVDEAKDIHDTGEALRLYLKKSGKGMRVVNKCAEITIRAAYRGGQILIDMTNRGERRTKSDGLSKVTHQALPKLSDLGIDDCQATRWQKIARIPEKALERHFAEISEKSEKEREGVWLTMQGVLQLANIILREEQAKELEGRLEERPLVPYGKNIFYVSRKPTARQDAYHFIGENDSYPTLMRYSWFFHKKTKTEFTLREYARVQTFPDTFRFVGTYNTIKDQVGNAVAPHMAKHVGKRLKGETFGDLFAGCGGLSCGLEMLGKKAVWAVERDARYARTFKANHPGTDMVTRDIRMLDPNDFKKVDIIVGGPPCQGFSLSGIRFRDDPRNGLYKEFLRFVNALRPREFLMENVMAIRGLKGQIAGDFTNIGYSVDAFEIRGEDIGMRQKRNRFFFLGKREWGGNDREKRKKEEG